jgi:hypothetical protein
VWPDHWASTISVDDACYGYYSAKPQNCGIGLSTGFDGEITEQPTWMVMDAIRLAGVTPVRDGYEVTPHLPMDTFTVRLPETGVARAPGLLRGYVRVQHTGRLRMHVTLPPGGSSANVQAFAGGQAVPCTVRGGRVTFTLPARAGRPADWAVTD